MEVDEASFQSHLKSLNIGPVDVSFGWLLDDGNEILNWFYKNIDSNNCLSAADKAEYAILEETGKVFNESDLENEVSKIFEKYSGIADPSIQDSLEIAKLELEDLEELSNLLKEQDSMRNTLLVQDRNINNDILIQLNSCNEELTRKTVELSDAMKECKEAATKSRIKKMKYFQDIEELLNICNTAKKSGDNLFFSEKPLEIYYERTKLLETYLKLYLTRQFDQMPGDTQNNGVDTAMSHSVSILQNMINDLGDDSNLAELKVTEICKKLEEGLWFYMKNKAALNGILEEIKYVHTYDMDCCYDSQFEKVKNVGLVDVLQKDVEIFSQQHITVAIHKFINQQCEQLLLGEVLLKLEKTKYIHNKLCETEVITQQALNHNIILHMCLQRDQLCVDNLLKFSVDAINDLQSAISAHKSRAIQFGPVKENQSLMEMLRNLFNVEENMAAVDLAKKIELTITNVESMEKSVFHEQFVALLKLLKKRRENMLPLFKMIWSGPTDYPVICNKFLENKLYELKLQNDTADIKIKDLAKNFVSFKKNLEKHPKFCIENLWIWFLTDPEKIRQYQEPHHV